MTSNGTMNDYLSEMEKYLSNGKADEAENKRDISIDKDKLYENFMMFMNNRKQGSHKEPSLDKEKKIHHGEDETTSIVNEPNHSNPIKQSKTITEIKCFDDIPIVKKPQSFLEILEKNLSNQDYYEENEDNKPRKSVEYRPRPRRSDLLNIQPPKETKKYKYYSENFNKNFDKDNINEALQEEIKLNELKSKEDSRKGKKTIPKKKVTTKINELPKVKKPSIDNYKSNAKDSSFVSEMSTKKTTHSSNANKNTGNIWNEIDYEDNDFLNFNLKKSGNFNEKKILPEPEYQIPMVIKNQSTINKTQSKVNTSIDASLKNSQMYKNNSERSFIQENTPTHIMKVEEEKYLKEIINNQSEQKEEDDSLNEENSEENDDRDIIRMYEDRLFSNNATETKYTPEYKTQTERNGEGIVNTKKPEQSKIINKYFKPLIRDKKIKIKEDPAFTEEKPQNNFQDIINEKVNELNKEIDKLKKENDKANKLKSEYERLTKKLTREVEEFNTRKERETEEFERYKEEEIKKIEKERKVHLRNTKLLQNMPNRKEREEIEQLKEQNIKLQDDMKQKDQRNKLTNERSRKQLEEANRKIEDLQKEIKIMEELRVKNMSTPSASTKNISKSNTMQNNYNTVSTKELSTQKSAKNLKIQQITNSKTVIKTSIEKESFKHSPIGIPKQPVNKIEDSFSDDYQHESNDEEADYTASKNIQNFKSQVKSFDDDLDIKLNRGKVIKTTKNDTAVANIKTIEKNVSQAPISKVNYTEKLDSFLTQLNDKKKNQNYDSSTTSGNKYKNRLEKSFEEGEDTYELIFPDKYHSKSLQNLRLLKQDFTEDGKIIKLYENSKREVRFPSGAVKEIHEDGYQVTYFNNKDIKQVYPDKKEVYLFAENKTLQFKFPDGLQVFKFEGGQIEKHFPDGTKVVNYIDGTIRNVYPDGYEETFFPDGSLQKVDKNGVVTIDYEDGLKDIIYPDGLKIREFPDGKVKKVFPDGRVENYYK